MRKNINKFYSISVSYSLIQMGITVHSYNKHSYYEHSEIKSA